MTRAGWLLIVVGLLGACARRSPERQIVEDAAAALGGRDRILAARTVLIEGQGTQGNLGQDMTPDATSQTFTVTAFRRACDLAAGACRTELTRTPGFPYFRGPAAQKQSTTTSGGEGYHHPLAIMRAALDPAAKLDNPRTIDSESVVAITAPNGLAFTLAIDGRTKLPTRVVSMADQAVLGDVAIETGFADYQDVNGLKLPTRLTTKTDSFTTSDLQVKAQTVDGDPGSFAGTQPPGAPAPQPPVTVAVEEVAPGVWLLGGQSHHTVAVEFADHLMLIEAPNEPRALAAIAKARELRPNKPVTQLVNSHHHFDHSGGVRAAVAEGLTIITHEANASFYQNLVGRSRTISPDALTRNPKPLALETVAEERVYEDETRAVHLYHIAGSPHGDAMLMAYLPRERIVIEADAYSPGSTYHPYAANLLENIRKRSLRVDRIVPLHGTVVPFTELVKATQAATTN